MGTDIHLYAEVRGADGRWSEVEPVDGSKRFYDSGSQPALFAVLANVRNDDRRRGDPFVPIDDPRGLPADVSPELRAAAAEWGEDGYAHSWLSVRELLEADWDRIAIRRGVVFAPEFARWDGVSAPDSFCVWVLSSRENKIDNDAMRRLVEEARAHGHPLDASQLAEDSAGVPPELRERIKSNFTTVSWHETYATTCAYFLEETLPKLLALGPPDDVRMVFWFDGY